jgi:hypothetical protein
MNMINTTGILIRKAQCQLSVVVSQPPASGPTAAMPPMVEPQMAKAIPRSRPVNMALTVDSVAGRIIAPPSPCNSLAMIRIPPFPARAANTLAAPNTTVPTSSSLRRPCMSPRRPAVIRQAANTNA